MRTLRWAIAAVAAVLASCGGGSDSTNSDASPTGTEWPVAPVDGKYRLGDTGPGGGIIVWVDEAGFDNSSGDNTSIGAVCLIGTCHYLEMAISDLRGANNWKDAVFVSENYSTASADDWVLPSKDALNVLFYFQLSEIDYGFSPDHYWSSSEPDSIFYSAWRQNFLNGKQSEADKGYRSYVRPVRAFGFESESMTGESSPTPTEESPTSIGASPADADTKGVYQLGDTGPGGGIIFYVDEEGFEDEACLIGICHYLETATVNLKSFTWSDAILAAENYSTASADDWVLPSLLVLQVLEEYRDRCLGQGYCGYFWSSTEIDGSNAWSKDLFYGNEFNRSKDDLNWVRPVRGF